MANDRDCTDSLRLAARGVGSSPDLAIGVLDSGIGGLNVLRELVRILPNERYVYYADEKNAPYGEKPEGIVKSLVDDAVEFMVDLGVKAVVIACNTATSVAIDELRAKYSVPIIGMEPAIKPALMTDKRVLLMATPVTIRSGRLKKLLNKSGEADRVDLLEAPRLVEFAEASVFDSTEVKQYIRELLQGYDLSAYSSLVLGCSHFSFFKSVFRSIFPENIQIFDGSCGTADNLKAVLLRNSLCSNSGLSVEYCYSGEILCDKAEIKRLDRLCGISTEEGE